MLNRTHDEWISHLAIRAKAEGAIKHWTEKDYQRKITIDFSYHNSKKYGGWRVMIIGDDGSTFCCCDGIYSNEVNTLNYALKKWDEMIKN